MELIGHHPVLKTATTNYRKATIANSEQHNRAKRMNADENESQTKKTVQCYQLLKCTQKH